MNHNESIHQASVIKWANLSVAAYPELKWLHCSLNGVKLSPIQAKIAKSQGMKAGISDLFLPVKRCEYSGLYIEMKYGKNGLTEEQEKFLNFVASQGYKTEVCYDWLVAKECIVNYLKGN
jgi:hypothetical protein